jgi:hypothetical protein
MQKQAAVISDGGFHPNENKQPDLGAQDIRFTTKGKTLYALVQGWPAGELVVTSLSTNGGRAACYRRPPAGPRSAAQVHPGRHRPARHAAGE